MTAENKSPEMSPVKQALQAVKEMQAKIAAMEMAKAEPIAVVGMACRFPGNANSPEELWELLRNGGDGIIDVPAERWDGDSFYDADPETPGKMITRQGGFLKDIDQFDAGFFGISPREANSMDPHQRLLLQTAWQALENGGFDINGLYGSRTGVYVGISNFEYGARLLWPENPDDITAYSGTGGSLGVTAGRLSYTLGFTGPSMIIDTACSSSLVTTHLAMQALRLGECDLALSAGVNLIFGPQTHINFSKARMLAPDGHCKTFSADADGYARGEGVGVILLKRLSDAERDKDHIIALLRGSAVNQDGPSGGLTVPNGPSQVKVIRAALENARLDPDRVGYIEAHGTGTPLGDPIEIGALTTVFGKEKRPASSPLYVASIKTNVGHLESAAGIAGIIKSILSVQHGFIPPHQNFQSPNLNIDWDNAPVTIPKQLTEWADEERIAGVSGFSFSGTNAHLILSNYKATVPETSEFEMNGKLPTGQPLSRLMVLSSIHEANLHALSENVVDDLRKLAPEKWSHYCVSSAKGRGHYRHRLALVAGTPSEAADLLESGSVLTGKRGSSPRRIAFMFTGQGSQYINMGRQLYEEEPLFRSIMEECDAIVTPLIGRSMLDMLYPDQTGGESISLNEKKSQKNQDENDIKDSRNGQKLPDEQELLIDRTEFTQPLLFSVEYALAKLWRSWGIEPDALIGHSLGELTAVTVAGLWSLKDALTLVCSRGSLMAEMCSEGAMAAIRMSEGDVATQLKKNKWASGFNIASINGPESVVVAGDVESIDRFIDEMTKIGSEVKRLRVSHAFHSPLVEPMIKKFGSVASGITFGKPDIPVISNVTGDFFDSNKMKDVRYWQEHIRQPVRFFQGLSSLLDDGFNTFIEIGPKPTLSAMGQIAAEGHDLSESYDWIPSMRYNIQPREQLLKSLGQLYVSGVDIAASAMNTGPNRYPVSLPTTPFVTDRYWYKHSPAAIKPQFTGGGHPLLGQPLSTPLLDTGSILYVNELSVNDTSFLAHHRVFGEVVLPAAGHLEMALAASNELFSAPGSLTDVTIQQALILPDDERTPVQTVVKPTHDGYHFDIYSRPGEAESWQKHTSGKLSKQLVELPQKVDLNELKKRCSVEVDVETYYQSSRALGIEHGEDFQALKNLWIGENEMLGKLELPSGNSGQLSNYLLSPVLLDAAFQMASYPLMEQGLAYLPTGLEQLSRYDQLPSEVWCYTSGSIPSGSGSLQIFETDIQLLNERGDLLAKIVGLRFQRATNLPQIKRNTTAHPFEDWLYEIDWKQKPLFGFASTSLQSANQIGEAVSDDMDLAVESCAFYGPLFTDMDQLASDYIQKELLNLKWKPEPGLKITTDDLVKKAGITKEFQSLFIRCLGMLEEDGYIQFEGESLQILKPFERLPADKVNKLRERFKEADPEMTLFFRCAESLGAVWRGDVDPLSLLFPEGDLTVTTLLYQHSVGARSINTILAKAVREAINDIPASKGVRILEIGGGTGGTTAHLLPMLPADRCDYLFTDISAHFTKQASKEFGNDYPFMRFGTLDIEKEPASDLHGQFDLIIAANVVHATKELGLTLKNCKSLLAPGGQLVLLEASAKQRWLDLTFGMTEGWWRFKGHDPNRMDYPLLSPKQWKSILPEYGFGPVTLLGPDDASGEESLKQHVVIAGNEDTTAINERNSSGDEIDRWLIVGEESESLNHLVELLPGESEVILTSQLVDEQSDTERLKELMSGSLKGIIMMHALDSGSIGGSTSDSDPLSHQHHLIMPILRLTGEIVNSDQVSSPRLWMVTQDAIAFRGRGDGFSQASLHGLVRTLKSEHPGLQPVVIDLPSGAAHQAVAGAIWLEIQSGEIDEQVVYREDGRWVSRLTRNTRESVKEIEISEEASYLITGGLGDLGLKIAQYLVQKGARHLVLMSRSKPDKRTKQAVNDLEKAGATIDIANIDVTDETAVKELINRPDNPPLRGVIHAAGTLADGILAKMEWEKFELVLSAKIAGAWNLHNATAGEELDFFILFSSIGSIFGPAAQGNYTAANACIDQFAGYRRQQGLPALVINWGTWSEIGLAARQHSGGQVGAMKGITPISPSEGVELFDAIKSEQGQIVAVPANWPVLFEFLPEMALLDLLRQNELEKPKAVEQKRSWMEDLHELPVAEQHELLLKHVSEHVAQVLGAKVDSLDVTAGFFDLGMDSLTSVEMRNALQKSLGRDLPSTLIFKYPSISAVVGYLAEQIIDKSGSVQKPAKTVSVKSDQNSVTGSDHNDQDPSDGSSSEGSSFENGRKTESKSSDSLEVPSKKINSEKIGDDVNEMTEEELNALINDEFDNMMEDDS